MDFVPTNISEQLTSLSINFVGLTVVDVLTVVMGQPVMAKMLWVTCTSSKPIDVLTLNLAIFYNLHHWLCTVHLLFLYLLPWLQDFVLRLIFIFAQTGGPMNLAFISVERYVAVIYPTSYQKLKQYRFREMCAASVWFMSITICFLCAFLKSPLFISDWDEMANVPLVWMVTTTSLVVHSSIRIAKALKEPGVGNSKLHPGKKKALKTVVATLHIVLLCYGSLSIILRLGAIVVDTLRQFYMIPCGLCLLSAASIAHPVYHLFSQGRLFYCLRQRGKGA